MTGIDWSALYPTPVRVKLLQAIHNEPGRIYYERAAKAVFDKTSGRRVTAQVDDFVSAQWIRTAKPEERAREEWSDGRTYYRLTDLGRAAIERGRR